MSNILHGQICQNTKISSKNGNFANSIFRSWWKAFFIKGKKIIERRCNAKSEISQRQRLQIWDEARSHFSDEIGHLILMFLGASILWLDKQVLFSSTSPGLLAGKLTLFVWYCLRGSRSKKCSTETRFYVIVIIVTTVLNCDSVWKVSKQFPKYRSVGSYFIAVLSLGSPTNSIGRTSRQFTLTGFTQPDSFQNFPISMPNSFNLF